MYFLAKEPHISSKRDKIVLNNFSKRVKLENYNRYFPFYFWIAFKNMHSYGYGVNDALAESFGQSMKEQYGTPNFQKRTSVNLQKE